MADAGAYVASGNPSWKVVAVAAGEAHTLALTDDGSVYAWGRGTFGRLGTGSELDRLFPVKIEFNSTAREDKVKIVGVAAGAYHSLALADDGSVWSWGYNTYGQLGVNGENSFVPCLVDLFQALSPPSSGPIAETETGLKISSVKAGGMMSIAVDDIGALWMWGHCPLQDTSSTGGGLSLATTYTPIPVWDFHGHRVVKVACGTEHIVALVGAGETPTGGGGGSLVCYTWGKNKHGQLGLGDEEMRSNPQVVETFDAESPWGAYEVACGAFHTAVLSYRKTETDALVSVCWTFGLCDNGQLGHGTTRKSAYPETVGGLPDDAWLVSVDCGLFHTSVVSSAGNVWSWGMENGLGLCPEATFTESDGGDALTPRLINGPHGPNFPEPIQVVCGAAHTVLVADGGYKLWAWGRGRSGVLGNGQVNDFFAPNVILWPPLDEDFKERSSETVNDTPKTPETDTGEIDLLRSRLSVMERYASILHGAVFGGPLDGVPASLRDAGPFDVAKEWENVLESCDRGGLVRLETFYRNMLAGVRDKMMKRRVHEMVKECLESSTSRH